MVQPGLPIPPYVPYRTFRNFLEQLRAEGIPARIDRSVWGARYSGSSGLQIVTALRVLGLIDREGRPAPELERLARSDGDERRAALRALLERRYQPIFELDLTRATKAQFQEAFRVYEARDGVLRKCENFFVQAAQDAGVELSPYILARRHTTRRQPAAPRPRAMPQAGAPLPVEAAAATAPRTLAEMVLAKYPDFDPGWEPEVQARWIEGMERLCEALGRDVPEMSAADRATGSPRAEDG
jgi:hypothetical protein